MLTFESADSKFRSWKPIQYLQGSYSYKILAKHDWRARIL